MDTARSAGGIVGVTKEPIGPEATERILSIFGVPKFYVSVSHSGRDQ